MEKLYSNNPTYELDVTLEPGWNDVAVDWSFNNSYIVAHQFSFDFPAALDESAAPSVASHVLFAGSGWDDVTSALSGLGVDGEYYTR